MDMKDAVAHPGLKTQLYEKSQDLTPLRGAYEDLVASTDDLEQGVLQLKDQLSVITRPTQESSESEDTVTVADHMIVSPVVMDLRALSRRLVDLDFSIQTLRAGLDV